MTITSNHTHPASSTTPSGIRQPPASASLSLSLSLNQHQHQQQAPNFPYQQQVESPYYPQRFLPTQMVMGSPFYQNSDSSFKFNSPVTDNGYSTDHMKNNKLKLNSKKLDRLVTTDENGQNNNNDNNNNNNNNNSKTIQAESSPLKSSSPPPPLLSSKSSNINTRSLKFSNLRNDITLAEFLELINFGPIETCYFDLNSTVDDSTDSRSIIISFIDGRVANDCYIQLLDIIDELKHLLDSSNLSVDPTNSLPLSDFIQNEININGASRVICLSNLHHNLNNDILFNELSNFGTIQLIDYNINKNAAFVYFTSIFMAIKCFDQLPLSNSILSNCKIFYSNDSITFLNNHHSNDLNSSSYLTDTFANYNDINEENENENEEQGEIQQNDEIVDEDDDIQFYHAQDNTNSNMIPYSTTSTSISTPRIASTTDLLSTKRIISNNKFNSGFFNDPNFNTPLAPTISNNMYDLSLQNVHNSTFSLASLPQNNIGNRTVYLGNLTSNTTCEDICNKIRGGIIEKIKIFSEKRVAFVSFVYHEDAANFISRFFSQNLFINTKCVKIGWGKNSGNLSQDILSTIENDGACRNLYIGVNEELETNGDFQLVRIDPFESKSGEEEFKKVFNLIPNEKTLRSDFSIFGDIEQINFFKNGSCAFINFTNIYSCINAIEKFQNSDYNDPNDGLHKSFDDRYRKLNISFGKDRCANPPKKKRSKKKSNDNNTNTNNKLDSSSNRPNTPNIQFHTFSLSDDSRSIDTDLALKYDNAFTAIGISSPSATKKVEVIKDDTILQSTVLESGLETSSGKEDLPNTTAVIDEDDEDEEEDEEDEDDEDIDIITDTLSTTDESKQQSSYKKTNNNKNNNTNNNNTNGRYSNQRSNKSTRRNSYNRNPSRLYSCSRTSSMTSFHNYPYNNQANNISFTYNPENSFVSDNQSFIITPQPYYFSPPQGSAPAQYPVSTMPSTPGSILPYSLSSSYYPQQPQTQQQPTAPPGYYYYSTPHHRSLPQLHQLPHAQPLQQSFEYLQPQQPYYNRRYSKSKTNGKLNRKGECSSSNCTSNDNSTPEF